VRISVRQRMGLLKAMWKKIEDPGCAIMLRLMCCNSSRIRQSLARQRNACSASTRVLRSHPPLTKGMLMQRFHQVNATLAASILLMAFAAVAGAQGLKTAQEIVDFSASKTSAYKTWSGDCNQVVNMMGSQVAMNGQMVQKLPHSMWMQLDMPMMGQQSRLTTIMGQDGIMWQVVQTGAQPQIMKIDMNRIGSNTFAQTGMNINPLDQFNPSKQWELSKTLYDFTVARSEQLEGQPMYVLEGTWKQAALTNQQVARLASVVGKMRVLIGQDDGFMHRMEQYDKSKTNSLMTMEFKNLKFNPDVPDSTFVYRPPTNAPVMDMTPMVEMQLRAQSATTPSPRAPAPVAKPSTP
jgi:outer membrane lipoprotein-sorting protein